MGKMPSEFPESQRHRSTGLGTDNATGEREFPDSVATQGGGVALFGLRHRPFSARCGAVLGVGFLLVALSACVAPAPPPQLGPPALEDEGETLRELAEDAGISIGSSMSPRAIFGGFDRDYQTLLERHFSSVTPEYGLYMAHVQPSQGVWGFDLADTVVAFAQSHSLTLRGHALVWGVPQRHDLFGDEGRTTWTPTPRWVHESDMSRDEAIAVMRDHIETVMRQYAGKIDEWHVVNEPIGGQFGARKVNGHVLSPNVWLEKIGPDYIKLAFEHARSVDPDATLILNEWGADYIGQDHGWIGNLSNRHDRPESYYNLVVHLLEQGTPIDGVGLQFHLDVELDDPSVDAILDNLNRYHALGLSTHITEMDVRIPKPVTAEKLRKQARLYETVFRAALRSPSTKDVMIWDFTDRYSWITSNAGFFPDHAVGTIMDDDLRLYPSFQAIREVLSEARRERRN